MKIHDFGQQLFSTQSYSMQVWPACDEASILARKRRQSSLNPRSIERNMASLDENFSRRHPGRGNAAITWMAFVFSPVASSSFVGSFPEETRYSFIQRSACSVYLNVLNKLKLKSDGRCRRLRRQQMLTQRHCEDKSLEIEFMTIRDR